VTGLLARVRRWWHCSRGECDPVLVASVNREILTCTCGIVWWCSDGSLRVGSRVRPMFKKREP